MRRMCGVTTSPPTVACWPTRGRAGSRGRTSGSTDSKAHPRGRVSAERVRPLRHGGQRVGVDVSDVFSPQHAPARVKPCCSPDKKHTLP